MVLGFNYQFDALETTGDGNALNDAFHELLHGKDSQRVALFRLIQWYAPILKIVVRIPRLPHLLERV
jgi:hypothetical protein